MCPSWTHSPRLRKTAPEAGRRFNPDPRVGGYAERHIKGVLTILFLRKTSAPNTPYVTIEMDGNRIMQFHGYSNERGGGESPRKVHKEFLDTWLAWLKAGSRRNKDGSPVLPKRKEEARSA